MFSFKRSDTQQNNIGSLETASSITPKSPKNRDWGCAGCRFAGDGGNTTCCMPGSPSPASILSSPKTSQTSSLTLFAGILPLTAVAAAVAALCDGGCWFAGG